MPESPGQGFDFLILSQYFGGWFWIAELTGLSERTFWTVFFEAR